MSLTMDNLWCIKAQALADYIAQPDREEYQFAALYDLRLYLSRVDVFLGFIQTSGLMFVDEECDVLQGYVFFCGRSDV